MKKYRISRLLLYFDFYCCGKRHDKVQIWREGVIWLIHPCHRSSERIEGRNLSRNRCRNPRGRRLPCSLACSPVCFLIQPGTTCLGSTSILQRGLEPSISDINHENGLQMCPWPMEAISPWRFPRLKCLWFGSSWNKPAQLSLSKHNWKQKQYWQTMSVTGNLITQSFFSLDQRSLYHWILQKVLHMRASPGFPCVLAVCLFWLGFRALRLDGEQRRVNENAWVTQSWTTGRFPRE